MQRSQPFQGAVELGITEQYAAPGDHIAYFWENDAEFRAAVRFLEVGIREGDHCVIFGHQDANARVIEQLLCERYDCTALQASGQLTIVPGSDAGEKMLADIAGNFRAAANRGAKLLRLLGNIGWGKPDWPDDTDILAFEARVTEAIKSLPAVVVCMYDLQNLRGDLVVRGALETHPLTIRRNVLRENEHYVALREYLAELDERKSRAG